MAEGVLPIHFPNFSGSVVLARTPESHQVTAMKYNNYWLPKPLMAYTHYIVYIVYNKLYEKY